MRLCSLWSDDSVPAYIGAAGQADPAEQFFDYHHDLYHDVLTNAYNRRFFEKQLRKLVEVDAIAMLDLDQFKQINDVYGHQAGDDALRILVSAVTACVRNRNDALVRYGGDEFLLIFPHNPEASSYSAGADPRDGAGAAHDRIPRPASDGQASAVCMVPAP